MEQRIEAIDKRKFKKAIQILFDDLNENYCFHCELKSECMNRESDCQVKKNKISLANIIELVDMKNYYGERDTPKDTRWEGKS